MYLNFEREAPLVLKRGPLHFETGLMCLKAHVRNLVVASLLSLLCFEDFSPDTAVFLPRQKTNGSALAAMGRMVATSGPYIANVVTFELCPS